MLLNIIKALYDKPIANIILNKEKLKLFLLIRNETRVSPCHPCLSPCISINSKWIKDLNIRPETLKVVKKTTENTLEAIGIGKDFLSRTLIGSATNRKDPQIGLLEILKVSAQPKKWLLN
jgi:hypothetical protein